MVSQHRVWSAWWRSCVDLGAALAEIVCQSHSGDRVSISERYWIYLYSVQIWKIFTEVENVERESKMVNRVLHSVDRGSVDRAVHRHAQELKAIDRQRSTNVAWREENPSWRSTSRSNRPNSRALTESSPGSWSTGRTTDLTLWH